MFVELPKRHFEKLKGFLLEQRICYEISDCTLPEDKESFVHLELPDYGNGLNSYQIEAINSRLDAYFLEDKENRGLVAKKTEKSHTKQFSDEKNLNQKPIEKELEI